MLLIIILLASCAKPNFHKDSKFYSTMKPLQESCEDNFEGTKDVNYVLYGEKDEEEKMDSSSQSKPINARVEYDKAKTLLDIQKKEEEAYIKELKKIEENNKIKVDYKGANKLVDMIEKEEEAKRSKESSNEKSSSSHNQYSQPSYGYEKTIWGDEDLFC